MSEGHVLLESLSTASLGELTQRLVDTRGVIPSAIERLVAAGHARYVIDPRLPGRKCVRITEAGLRRLEDGQSS